MHILAFKMEVQYRAVGHMVGWERIKEHPILACHAVSHPSPHYIGIVVLPDFNPSSSPARRWWRAPLRPRGTKTIILPPRTVTATTTAKAVRITLPPRVVTKTATVTTTSTSTPQASRSGAPLPFTFTKVSWIPATSTVTEPIYRIEYETTTIAASPTGVGKKYAICDAQYMYGPVAEDGNNVLSLYDPPYYSQQYIYPVFTAEDCCNICAANGACTSAAWYYGHSCYIQMTYDKQCAAQTDYHASYVESTTNLEGFLDDTIMNGPCGFVTWDGQVLDTSGVDSKRKRQMAEISVVKPGEGGLYGGPGIKIL